MIFYLLNFQYLYNQNKIIGGYYITQTRNQAVNRHRMTKPNTNSTGNYIEFERLISDFDYYSTFLSVPIIFQAIEDV